MLYRELDKPDGELLVWAQRSGLVNGKADLRRVLAQQAALELLLLTVAEHLSTDALSDLPLRSVTAQLPYSGLLASTQARHVLGSPAYLLGRLKEALPRDLLGELYELLTPQAERRTLGQYWTPQPIVEFMSAWASEAGHNVLEPAVGSGRFLQELERRLSLDTQGEKAFVRGYEISPLVLMIALINAALRRADNVHFDLHLSSFLDDPGNEGRFDAVVCNPPYTRHHHITPEHKGELAARIQRTFGISPSGFTSLFVYFFLHSLRQIRPGGRLAFITPAELYEASYAVQVKTILRQEAQPDAIIVFDPAQQVFEGVDTAGCITLAHRNGSHDGQTLLIEIRIWPGTAALLDVVNQRLTGEHQWGTVTLIAADDLTPTAKWSNPRQMTAAGGAEAVEHLPTLASLANVVRGVATGANDYFCLSAAEVEATGIPLNYFQPVITRTRTVQTYRLQVEHLEHLQAEGQKVWLFTCYEPREVMPAAVRKYVAHGEDEKLHERSLLKLKKAKWYMAERRLPPPILFTYLSRGGTRFIYNAAGAQALNVFLLIYPKREIAQHPVRLQAFTAILNANPIRRGLHVVGRSYGGDTVKLEPRELDLLPVLDPTQLPEAVVERLAALLAHLDNDLNGAYQTELDLLVTELIAAPAQRAPRFDFQPSLF